MPRIDHVVVLMLENRSFDHVLGWLRRDNADIEGLTGGETNPSDSGANFLVTAKADRDQPVPFDPPHDFDDVTEHIFGVRKVGASNGPGRLPTMRGFYRCAERAAIAKNLGDRGYVVLDGYAPGRLPSIHALAREFGICDAWFSSVPGPTWPNRFFAHCATAGGYLDGKFRSYPMPTVFGRMDAAGQTWKLYFHDVPQAVALDELRPFVLSDGPYGGLARFSTFLSDAKAGNLPRYSFIEPNYWDISLGNIIGGILPGGGSDNPSTSAANDAHPPMSMRGADDLVRVVYQALRRSRAWDRTVLLVVWDEHGGFFDHVQPLAVRSPDDVVIQENFRFDRLGVRVPAIVASPWVPRGTVSHTIFEHASIAATLRDLFDIAPLTERDRYANSFASLLSLEAARQDTPRELPSVAAPLPGPEDEEDIDLGPAGRSLQRSAAKKARDAGRTESAPTKVELGQPELTNLQQSLAALWQNVGGERFAQRTDGGRRKRPSPPSRRAAKKPMRAEDSPPTYLRSAVVDKIDIRDRWYAPPISKAPPVVLRPSRDLPRPLDQKGTQACTGYALAALIDYLLLRAGRAKDAPVSPRMLYSMARRYDEWPGATADTGSSLRAALKGWFRHGACSYGLWDDSIPPERLPPSPEKPKRNKATSKNATSKKPTGKEPNGDWWPDALRRPLGAYYRLEKESLATMHAALTEVGAIYASADAHGGWDAGFRAKKSKDLWTIPYPPPPAAGASGGHAFVIVGYDDAGFIIQNSWGSGWGTRGLARLEYADWLDNSWDAWVVQLGVPTAERKAAAAVKTLRVEATADRLLVPVAADAIVRDHELGPFILDAGNNGRLSNDGPYRTQPDDVRAWLEDHQAAFRDQFDLRDDIIDVAIYAHGGLVDQKSAAETAGKWVPALYQHGILPLFVMWETGLFEILGDLWKDAMEPRAGRLGGSLWDRRFERFAAPLGTPPWSKIKRNAAALSRDATGALRLLFEPTVSKRPLDPKRTRLHLIGHSAGSIVVSELASWLIAHDWTIESMTFLAAALRVDRFAQLVAPCLGTKVRRLRHYALRDATERTDPTVPLYGKSLLYLVSRSFEGGTEVPILGMEIYGKSILTGGATAAAVDYVDAPGDRSRASTHGGFDDDPTTRSDVIEQIRACPR